MRKLKYRLDKIMVVLTCILVSAVIVTAGVKFIFPRRDATSVQLQPQPLGADYSTELLADVTIAVKDQLRPETETKSVKEGNDLLARSSTNIQDHSACRRKKVNRARGCSLRRG